ncbi:MAG: heavy metal-associated domain-containing protein [Spongiibacteraceae bacterium]
MKTALLFLLLSAATAANATQTLMAQVNGMVCAFCAQGIEKKARTLPQTQDVYVNLKKKIVAVQIKDGETLEAKILKDLVKDAGYDVTEITIVEETTAAMRARLEHE